jgi:hypothetical protein
MLNLFYQEPDPDRWIKYDRYPRKLIRRLIRGKERLGGVAMVAINLMKGLENINVAYRLNDFNHIKKHPEEIACIIGKPQVLFDRKWTNPIIFGAGIYSHPIECPDLFDKYPNVKRVLVPGEWVRQMFAPYYNDKVLVWPVGTDIDQWKPDKAQKSDDFLVYDKIMWDYEEKKEALLAPILQTLNDKGLSFKYIRYGKYMPGDLIKATRQCKAVIFICEHESQGLAYQQILATGTPILAWEKSGYWIDPYYFPDKVKFEPVSSVPYWDERCGMKFKGPKDFETQLNKFMDNLQRFKPRDYIMENLTLEKCAEAYLKIYNQVMAELA